MSIYGGDSELLRQRFEKGAIFVLLDAPIYSDIGIDNHEFQIGPNFRGIKMIPPGFHYISYNINSKTSHKLGLFKIFKESELYLTKWDSANEDLFDDSKVSAEEVQRMMKSKYELDRFLAPYPLESEKNSNIYKQWCDISDFIRESDLQRILPGNSHRITSMTESNIPDETGIELQHLSKANFYGGDKILNFTLINLKKSFRDGASGPEISKYSQDKSWLLKNLLESTYENDPKRLLAELQLAFISLVFASNFEGFEQWKRIFHLICLSREAVSDTDLALKLFGNFLIIIEKQMSVVPKEMLDEVLATDKPREFGDNKPNFIRYCLRNLTSSIMFYLDESLGERMIEKLRDQVATLCKYLIQKYGWDLIQDAKKEEKRLDEEDLQVIPSSS